MSGDGLVSSLFNFYPNNWIWSNFYLSDALEVCNQLGDNDGYSDYGMSAWANSSYQYRTIYVTVVGWNSGAFNLTVMGTICSPFLAHLARLSRSTLFDPHWTDSQRAPTPSRTFCCRPRSTISWVSLLFRPHADESPG